MPRQLIKSTITLTAGGGTTSIDVTDLTEVYTIVTSGSVTLAANVVIESSGSLYEGVYYEFEYDADIDADGNTITFFGETMPDSLTNKECKITAYYDGSAWTVKFIPSINETRIIGKTQMYTSPYVLLDYAVGTNSTATLSEEVLGTVTFSSGVFESDGDAVMIVAFGRTKANADTKGMKIRSNDLNVINPHQTYTMNATTTAPNGLEFIAKATIIRKSATVAHHIGEFLLDGIAPDLRVQTSSAVYDFAVSPAETLTFSFTSTLGTATADDVELDAIYAYKIIQ